MHYAVTGGACGQVEQEWAQFADLILGWAVNPATLAAPGGVNTPGLFKSLSGEGEPPTPGAPTYSSSSDAAWETLVSSEYHRLWLCTCRRTKKLMSGVCPGMFGLLKGDSGGRGGGGGAVQSMQVLDKSRPRRIHMS